MRILITGGSGSGTTTLAQALGEHLRCKHLDLDDYFWLPTSPPFRHKRDPVERLSTLLRDLRACCGVVVSGSPLGWGAELEDAFDSIVFLYLPAATRLERLRRRETQRFGAPDPDFLAWASQYDEGPPEGRSLGGHLAWLAQRTCPVIRLETDESVAQRMRRVLDSLPAASA
jgi:hypothetical protein